MTDVTGYTNFFEEAQQESKKEKEYLHGLDAALQQYKRFLLQDRIKVALREMYAQIEYQQKIILDKLGQDIFEKHSKQKKPTSGKLTVYYIQKKQTIGSGRKPSFEFLSKVIYTHERYKEKLLAGEGQDDPTMRETKEYFEAVSDSEVNNKLVRNVNRYTAVVKYEKKVENFKYQYTNRRNLVAGNGFNESCKKFEKDTAKFGEVIRKDVRSSAMLNLYKAVRYTLLFVVGLYQMYAKKCDYSDVTEHDQVASGVRNRYTGLISSLSS